MPSDATGWDVAVRKGRGWPRPTAVLALSTQGRRTDQHVLCSGGTTGRASERHGPDQRAGRGGGREEGDACGGEMPRVPMIGDVVPGVCGESCRVRSGEGVRCGGGVDAEKDRTRQEDV